MGTYGASNISFSCTKDLEFMLFNFFIFYFLFLLQKLSGKVNNSEGNRQLLGHKLEFFPQ